MNSSADVSKKPASRDHSSVWWPTTTLSWIALAFLIALASTIIVLAIFGIGERGTAIALRVTARWSFLLFWPAYAGSAMARLFGPRLDGLARRGRDFGLAFAAAHVVHIGLVLWIFYLAPRSNGGMVFFWVGIFCTYFLALISLPQIHGALGPILWRILRTVATEYIALVFAADFILLQLQPRGHHIYSLSYLPFAFMLIAGAALRVGAHLRQQVLAGKIN